jgi:hypothetical protein
MERDKKSQQAGYLLTILLKILKVVRIWSWSAPLSFKYWINCKRLTNYTFAEDARLTRAFGNRLNHPFGAFPIGGVGHGHARAGKQPAPLQSRCRCPWMRL